jgi:hypothetical protein
MEIADLDEEADITDNPKTTVGASLLAMRD